MRTAIHRAPRTIALTLLLTFALACASRAPEVHRGIDTSAEVTLRRARDMYWQLQAFQDGERVAEGPVSQIGTRTVVIGGAETSVVAIDSLYRYVPRPHETTKRFAMIGGILGGLALLPFAAFCWNSDSCALVLVGSGMGLGAALGGLVGGALLESDGSWYPYWYR